jgi:hypothetical protein
LLDLFRLLLFARLGFPLQAFHTIETAPEFHFSALVHGRLFALRAPGHRHDRVLGVVLGHSDTLRRSVEAEADDSQFSFGQRDSKESSLLAVDYPQNVFQLWAESLANDLLTNFANRLSNLIRVRTRRELWVIAIRHWAGHVISSAI